ncbi:uncharacterized protein LOC112126379 [Cimex lectularius]|uniref:Triokinase/FMN cyclase n=1 Tax=Cimex lectularius TaxID=79782 RepID=A0A8I6SG11_CIMLE|nr:uncharacterized protein LOC112126379 [Cimex lectularius]
MSKSLVNSLETAVMDYLRGLKAVYPGLFIDIETQFVMLNRERNNRVALLSGSGAGHEPYGAGFVGENMLTGYVAGNVFTAPPTGYIVTALSNLAKLNKGGILVIILNYTGDMLNFGLAIENARNKGIQVESVLVADDSGHMDTDIKTGFVGRRGLCGGVLMIKILGAMSTAGRLLKELVVEGRCISCRMCSFGLAIKPCYLPCSAEPLWTIDDDQIEIGVGVHGEAGLALINFCTTAELVRILVAQMLKIFVGRPGDSIVALINDLGTCIDLELFTFSAELKRQLTALQINIVRLYTGKFLSSLDTKGVQVCMLNVTGRDDWIKFLDLETEAFAWPVTRLSRLNERFPMRLTQLEIDRNFPQLEGLELNQREGNIFKSTILAVARALRNEEQKLNLLDKRGGDGDCGTALRQLAEGFEKAINTLPVTKVAMTFLTLSKIAETYMSGTSGALYSLMFLGAAKNASSWSALWTGALEMVRKYSIAELGYRTMLDALIPACLAFEASTKEFGEKNWDKSLKFALDKAIEGCGKTATMKARVGRACYVDPSRIQDVDPGAYGVVVWLTAIFKNLVKQEGEDTQCPI